jgi:hypothetical protein
MRLPDTILDDILQCLEGDTGAAALGATLSAGAGAETGGPGAERRGASRTPAGGSVWYSRYGTIHPDTRPVAARDLSASGIGLVLREAVVAPGEKIVVHVPRGGGATLDLLCTVRASRVLRDGRMRVGAEFSEARAQGAADHAAAVCSAVGGSIRVGDADARRDARPEALWGSAASRRDLDAGARERREERVPLRGRGRMYVCLPDGTDAPEEGVYVADLSPGGVGIGRSEPLDVGEQFVIRVPRVDEAPVTRLCVVTRAEPAGDRFVIGARFIPSGRRRGRGWVARLFDWVV